MAKEELVGRVKNLQRTDPALKNAWWEFCDQEFGGVKDPAKHDENSLENFLSQHDDGTGGLARAPLNRPAPKGAGRATPVGSRPMGKSASAGPPQFGGHHMGGGGYHMGGGGMGCNAMAWGGKGPMQAMMPMHAMGGKGGMGGQSDPTELVTFIKVGQRLSPSFKEAWQIYCATEGGGTNDPSRHDPGFISAFIDYLGQLAQADLGQQVAYMQQPMHRQMGPPIVQKGPPKGMGKKRPLPMDSFGGEPAQKKGGGRGASSELVDRVKALQRSDPATKQRWWDFTDENHGGIHDPSRHSEDVLLDFLSQF